MKCLGDVNWKGEVMAVVDGAERRALDEGEGADGCLKCD
jgi:hypothetical protein